MSEPRLPLVATFAVLLMATVAACGSSSDKRLFGSAQSNYDLAFDVIEIQRQETSGGELDAMIVIYARDPDDPKRRQIPVKIVANAPLEEGKRRDITGSGGALIRVMSDGAQFPEMEVGGVTFDELGGEGETASGSFNITFKESGRTLNGEFTGTVETITL